MKACLKALRNVFLYATGWFVIGVACFQLSAPFFLPLTLDTVWVEKIARMYYRDLEVGSVHLVWRGGRVQCLVQDLKTPSDASQSIQITRAYVGLSLVKSLYHRRWVFDELSLNAGTVEVGLTDEYVEIGYLKLPIRLPPSMPIMLENMHLKDVKVFLSYENTSKPIYIKALTLRDLYRHGRLKAILKQDIDQSRWLQTHFEFDGFGGGALNGQLYLNGSDQALDEVLNFIEMPGLHAQGTADFDLWATFKEGAIQRTILDLKTKKIVFKKGQAEFQIDGLEGQWAYTFDGSGHRWVGHELVLHQGETLNKTSFILSSKDLSQYHLKAKNFNMDLVHFLLHDIPQVQSVFESFEIQPSGEVPYLEMHFDGDALMPSELYMSGENLAFDKGDVSVKGLAGKLFYKDAYLVSQWQGQALKIDSKQLYDASHVLQDYEIQSIFDFKKQYLHLQAKAEQDWFGQLDWLNQDEPMMALRVHLPTVSVPKLKEWLPFKKMPAPLSDWLQESLIQGDFKNLTLGYQGFFKNFFKGPEMAPFSLKAELDGVMLDYAKKWPKFERLEGQLEIEDHALQIDGSGLIKNAKVRQVHAHLPHLFGTSPLDVSGELEVKAKEVWDVLHQAGLIEKKAYESLDWEAQAKLNLALQVPLKHPKKTEFQGQAHVEEGQLDIVAPKMSFKNLAGQMRFDNHHLEATQLAYVFDEQPFHSDVRFNFDEKILSVFSEGALSNVHFPEALSQKKPVPYHSQFVWHFLDNKQRLEGTLHLAANKGLLASWTNAQKWPLDFTVEKKEDHPYELTAQLSEQGALWATVSHDHDIQDLHLHFGKNKPENKAEEAWQITGDLEYLDLTQWIQALKPYTQKGKGTNNIDFDVHIDELSINQKNIRATSLKGHFEAKDETWHVDIESPMISGAITLPMAPEAPWAFDMEYFVISDPTESSDPSQLPDRPLRLSINDLRNEHTSVRDFTLSLMPYEKGYIVEQLGFKVPNTTVEAAGFWSPVDDRQAIKLTGLIRTKNVQDLLKSFNKSSSIREAKGTIRFDLNYMGELFKPNLVTLDGFADIAFENGYIHGVNPGFGRILSLLSIDNLERRLRMDFGDITKRGLVFDTVEGRLVFEKGRLKTDDLIIESPNAIIEFKGEMAMLTERLQAQMIVMPNMTGSLPLAAAIAAGNPAVGAAVWLMDKMFGRKIQELNKYLYIISGTLQDPNVEEYQQGTTQITKR